MPGEELLKKTLSWLERSASIVAGSPKTVLTGYGLLAPYAPAGEKGTHRMSGHLHTK